MGKYFRVIFMAVLLIYASICYAQEDLSEGKPIITASGIVSDISWATSTIVVRLYNDEITFFVPHKAKITKGAGQVGFSEIQRFNKVTVKFIDDSPGPLKVISITIRK